jgi:hypothetical protein
MESETMNDERISRTNEFLVNELYGLTQERFESLEMVRNGEQEYERPKIPRRSSTCDLPSCRLSDSLL